MDREGHLSIICHSGGDFKGDILLTFGMVHAYQVHEEFAHPWLDQKIGKGVLPKSAEDSTYTFPFLKVNESIWMSTFSEIRLIGLLGKRLHLYILTLSYFVDILCDDYPQAKLVGEEVVDQLFDTIEVFEASDSLGSD
ncbi:MAG: hypothetical protein LH702_33190 [Phormidesmis sp. CAN_BIN44]|nr:hypothetical protein [Phormidesmis sp. CAN_BIN44]